MSGWVAALSILLLGVVVALVRFQIAQRSNNDVGRLSYVAAVVVAMAVLEFLPIFAPWSPSRWAIEAGFTTSRSVSIMSFCLLLCVGGIATLIATHVIKHRQRMSR
ncbi:MAG: hypothetical protein LKF41_03585 [Bifidobacterium sp.]|jgi:uncharacterized membrane protein YidH (DUF202 family)|nr:hypothetical protein [Bifidobacterium sp.]